MRERRSARVRNKWVWEPETPLVPNFYPVSSFPPKLGLADDKRRIRQQARTGRQVAEGRRWAPGCAAVTAAWPFLLAGSGYHRTTVCLYIKTVDTKPSQWKYTRAATKHGAAHIENINAKERVFGVLRLKRTYGAEYSPETDSYCWAGLQANSI